MLYERQSLPELHHMKHLHDEDEVQTWIKYDEVVLKNSLSPHIFENDNMSNFISRIEPLVALLLDQMNVVKNLKNYIVDKYDYRQR
jgi:hypothetical protein